jgi:hypothetical protein
MWRQTNKTIESFLPGVPGILTFIDKNIEHLIFKLLTLFV